ncbi:MAG: hypothetical protein HQL07_10245 [Nitrospirae bacterium]|nr:hypothetical protein [Magnetococcales bacterium]HAT49148.1 hypothetical protein [Alphaproteobacteria bacterium]
MGYASDKNLGACCTSMEKCGFLVAVLAYRVQRGLKSALKTASIPALYSAKAIIPPYLTDGEIINDEKE